jgi:hydroxyacylglutathione hydrolase
MLFERFEDNDLSQFSYAVGCPGAGKVAIVDPRRDIDVYLAFAEANDLEISHVLETHIHADFASGARELAEVTGAELCISAYDTDEAFEVQFPHTELQDGAEIVVGNVKVQAVHTPGHTPEHVAYLVYDMSRTAEVPELFLTGDFLFVGSIGRPDLLGEDAKIELANKLYDSIHEKLPGLPDGLEIHPAHGSESMCGAGISGRPMSTLGYERIANPYLQPMERQNFVDTVLGSVPPFPDYYRRMKQLNSDGPASLHDRPAPKPIDADEFKALIEDGCVVVDLRNKEAFAGGHVPGAYYVGHRPAMWGSWTVPYETPILIVGDDGDHANAGAIGLARVGLDEVRGYLRGGMERWEEHGLDVATIGFISTSDLSRRLEDGAFINVLDVRGDAQWESGAISGAAHVIAGHVANRLDEVPDGTHPLAIVCNTGFQSTIVGSVLARHGYGELFNVTGGMDAWRRNGLPLNPHEPQSAT